MTASDACMVDSNILVYAHDPRNPEQQQVAKMAFHTLSLQRRAALSVQCLTEFFNTVTRKFPIPVPVEDGQMLVEQYSQAATVLPITLDVVRDALDATSRYQMSMWDALVWAVANQNGIRTILTQDAQSQPSIGGIQYINPFAPGFDVYAL